MMIRRSGVAGPLAALMLFAPLLPHPSPAQFSDVTAPELVDFTFAPQAVDLSGGPEDVVFTFHVTDDLAGTSFVDVQLRSPSGAFLSQFATRISGDGLDGMYQAVISLEPFLESGTWMVGGVSLWDITGNNSFLNTQILAGRSFPTTLEITSDQSDTTPPVLTGIEFIPPSVDVSSSDQVIEVRLSATDDSSGLDFSQCCTSLIQIRSPSSQQYRFLWGSTMTLVSGDATNGVWSGIFPMPMSSEAGDWVVAAVSLIDAAQNSLFVQEFQLAALGVPELPVTSAPDDTTFPSLTGFSFSPTVINTSASSQFVTVTLDATDDLSGVVFAPTTPSVSFFENGVQFRSPSGNQIRRAAFFSPFALIAGTPQSGTWQAQVFFQQYSEEGTWKADFLQIKDRVRNQTSFTDAELETAGFPTQLVVLRPSLQGDGVVDTGGGTIVDDVFGDAAQVILPPGAVAEPTDVAIDVFLDPLDIPTPSGFIAPGTKFVNIELTPEPDYPLPPPGLTVILPLENPLPSGTALSLYKIDEATGNLIPAVSVFGGPVVGFVDGPGPDASTATFAGIASLSTIVGLIPETIPVTIDIRPESFPNPVNTRSRGVIPIAILGSNGFDVANLIPATLTFGPDGAGPAHDLTDPGILSGHTGDINHDGYPDLIFHVRQQDSGITSDDEQACVGGETTGGTPIVGCDAIVVVH